MLEAKNLCLTFNPGTPIETRALRGLSLTIPEGQFVTVIGSNGAGKSTFLNAISGDQSVDDGQIMIDNVDVTAHLSPSLTTVDMPAASIGSEAAALMLSRLDGIKEGTDQAVQLPISLVVRHSTTRSPL